MTAQVWEACGALKWLRELKSTVTPAMAVCCGMGVLQALKVTLGLMLSHMA